MKKAPDIIYLQIAEDEIGNYDADEVTWCADRVNDTDVKYARVDAIGKLERRVAVLYSDLLKILALEDTVTEKELAVQRIIETIVAKPEKFL